MVKYRRKAQRRQQNSSVFRAKVQLATSESSERLTVPVEPDKDGLVYIPVKFLVNGVGSP